jgi:hypothetical protein
MLHRLNIESINKIMSDMSYQAVCIIIACSFAAFILSLTIKKTP